MRLRDVDSRRSFGLIPAGQEPDRFAMAAVSERNHGFRRSEPKKLVVGLDCYRCSGYRSLQEDTVLFIVSIVGNRVADFNGAERSRTCS